MDDLEPVGIFDAGNNLLEEKACPRLLHPAVFHDVIEKLALGVF